MKIVFAVALLFLAHFAFATNGKTTYQAKIVKPDGYPLESANVNFRFSVLDAGGSCVLYVEDYAAVNMIGSGGLISFSLGDGVRSYPVSGTSLTFQNTFDNSLGAMACQNTGSFIPVSTDSRKIVMQFNDSSGWQTLPAMGINAVPYAMYADKSKDSKTLNGKSDTAFVEKSTLAALSCNSATHAIAFNGVSFSCIPVSASSGSVTGVTTTGSVLITGGTSAAPVISITAATMSSDGYLTSVDYAEFKAKLSVSSAQIVNTLGYAPVSGAVVTSLISSSGVTSATADTIVKRDSSGNSSFSGLSANTASLNYVDIYKPSTNFNIRLQAPTSLSANYTLNLPTTSGTTGQVLSTDGLGNLSWINSATGSVTSVSGTASEIISSGGSSPTIGLVNTGTAGTYYRVTTDNKGRVTSGVTTLTLSDLPVSVLNTTSNFSGDISGLISNITVNRIQGVSVTVSSLTTNDILQFDGSKYVNKNIPSCSGSQYLTFNGTSFSCVTDAGASGTITTISVAGPISSTGGSNPTISIAQSNSSTDGYLSSTDFNSFNNKITSSAASIAEVLGYVPASATASANYLVKTNNLSDLSSTSTARTNLGLGSLAVGNSIDLGSASATGTIADTRLLTQTGITSGTQYTKVTVDGKGRVTSGAQLNVTDVTTALGYTPASASASTQWNTSGTTINYTTGNVGIGIAAPARNLHIFQLSAANGQVGTDNNSSTNTSGVDFLTNGNLRGFVGLRGTASPAPTPTTSVSLYLWNVQNAPLIMGTSNVEVMRFSVAGNVGIGTSSPVTQLDVAGGVKISMEAATCAVSYAGTLRYNSGLVEYCNGTSWSAFGVAGAGITNFNGSTSGTQTFVTGTTGNAPAFVTANGIHTLNIPLASAGSVTGGLLSNVDYVTFMNKVSASSASVITALGFTPLNKASNLSDLTSATVARTNLGLGSLATLNSVDLSGLQASGTLAAARLPAFTGDTTSTVGTSVLTLSSVGAGVTSGTQYTKVTVDGKGRVISGAQIVSADITTALGYAPVSASSATQWVTSGTAISFTTGNVGVGTVAPTAKFEVSGAISGTTVTSVNYSIQGGNGNSIILKSYQDSGSNGSVYLGNGAGGFSTTGHATFFNTIMGHGSYMNNSSGAGNSIFGKSAAGGGSGSYNTVMGTFAAQNGIGDDNVIIGSYAGQGSAATNMSGNTLVGRQAGQNITTGSNNTVIGFLSASGSVGTGSNNILIGYNTGMAVSSTSNFINIGNTIYGNISTGNVGFGVTAPTALLQLKAGTASTGSLKFTSGTLLSSAQSGTMEYDGAQFYLTDGTNTRRTIATGSIAGSIDNASLINSTGNITMTPTGSVIVSSTTASTNSATGALVVKGGLGVAGNIYSSGTIITSSNIQGASITATSGMISPFIYGSTISGGDLRIESTTHATPGYITLAASGGSVGIGTLTPTEVLSVVGSGTGGRVARIVQTASSISNGSHTFEINSTSHTSNMTTAGAMAVDVNSGRAFTINGLGRIGIATSSPATLFANSNLNSLDSSSVGVTGSGIAWVSSATGYVATFTNLDATSGSRNVLLARAAATDATSYIFRGESGGVNRFTVRADGNVGIGTNSPQDKFDVLAGAVRSSRNPAQYMSIYGGDSTNQQVYIKGQAAENNKKRFTLQSVHDGSGSAAGFLGFEFQVGVVSAPTTMMTINEAGNVGIGINNPAQKLSVSGVIESTVGGFKFPDGTTQTTAATSAGATSIRAGWPDAIRCAYDASGQTVVMFPYGIYSDGSQDYIAGSPANYYIRFAADGSYTSATGLFNGTALNCVGRTLAQLTNSGQTWLLAGGGGNIWTQGVSGTYLTGGNVGIGTTSPSTTLDVRTSVSSSIKISDGGIEVQRNEPTSPNTGGYIDLKKSLNDDYRVRLYFNSAGGASAEGGLSIAVSDGVSGSEKAFFSSNGNVGIGTSAPTTKLEVVGDIKATGGGSIGVTRVLGTIGSTVTNITSSYTYIGDTITLPAGTWIVYYNNFYDTDGVNNFTTASYTHPGLSTTTGTGGMFDNGNVNVCGLNFCPINQTYFVTATTTTTYYVLQHISSYPGSYVRIRGGSWGKFFALKVN